MEFVERIDTDLAAAMKAGDAAKVSTLRMLKAEFMNAAIAQRLRPGEAAPRSSDQRVPALADAPAQDVLRRQIKQHRESLEAFKSGNRQDLVDKESNELTILEAYLPPQMTEPQLRAIVQECVAAAGAAGPKGMGQVMRMVMAKVQGQADGKQVSALVMQALGSGK